MNDGTAAESTPLPTNVTLIYRAIYLVLFSLLSSSENLRLVTQYLDFTGISICFTSYFSCWKLWLPRKRGMISHHNICRSGIKPAFLINTFFSLHTQSRYSLCTGRQDRWAALYCWVFECLVSCLYSCRDQTSESLNTPSHTHKHTYTCTHASQRAMTWKKSSSRNLDSGFREEAAAQSFCFWQLSV